MQQDSGWDLTRRLKVWTGTGEEAFPSVLLNSFSTNHLQTWRCTVWAKSKHGTMRLSDDIGRVHTKEQTADHRVTHAVVFHCSLSLLFGAQNSVSQRSNVLQNACLISKPSYNTLSNIQLSSNKTYLQRTAAQRIKLVMPVTKESRAGIVINTK